MENYEHSLEQTEYHSLHISSFWKMDPTWWEFSSSTLHHTADHSPRFTVLEVFKLIIQVKPLRNQKSSQIDSNISDTRSVLQIKGHMKSWSQRFSSYGTKVFFSKIKYFILRCPIFKSCSFIFTDFIFKSGPSFH